MYDYDSCDWRDAKSINHYNNWLEYFYSKEGSIIEFEKEADMILTLFREKGSQNNRFTKKRLTEIENEILEIEKQIQKLERQNIKSEQEVEILTFLNDKLSPLKKGKVTNEKKQSIARALINQIKIFWDEENLQHQIQINYKFDKHSEILLTKNLTLSYKKMGYSIRAKNYLENIRVELRSPSPRSLDVPDSKYLHIHHQTIK
jgi:hypothetical protein